MKNKKASLILASVGILLMIMSIKMYSLRSMLDDSFICNISIFVLSTLSAFFFLIALIFLV